MRRYIGYATVLVIVLTLVVWVYNIYIQPILPENINQRMVPFFVILLAVFAALSNFKDIVDLARYAMEKPEKALITSTIKEETTQTGDNILLSKKIKSTVISIYNQILECNPDENALLEKGKRLAESTTTVKNLIREIGKSQEYHEKFILSKSPQEKVRLMYKHFLGRNPDGEKFIREKIDHIDQWGWENVVDEFIDSDEYRSKFGEDSVPYWNGF